METFNDVISGNQLVLVDFFATWCQPCKMMHPILEDLKKTVGDKLRIIKVDVDAHNDVAAQYDIPRFVYVMEALLIGYPIRNLL